MPDIILMDIMLKGEMDGSKRLHRWGETNIPGDASHRLCGQSTPNKAKVMQPYGYIIKPFKEMRHPYVVEMALYKHKKEAEVLKGRDLLFNLVEGQGAGRTCSS